MQIRQRNYITSHCLRNVEESDWITVYRNGTDANFITLTSLNRASFEHLLVAFTGEYVIYTSVYTGEKLLRHRQALGCILTFYCDTIGGNKHLCQIFAIPPSTLSRVLLRAKTALQRALESLHEAEIRWPTLVEQREWATKVEGKNAGLNELVKGRWGFIDGKNFKVQTPSNAEMQNALLIQWMATLCLCYWYYLLWCRWMHRVVPPQLSWLME